MAMRSPLLQMVMDQAWMMRTNPVRMYGPSWRVGPSWISSVVLAKGPGVPSVSDISEIPEAPQGLPQGLTLGPGLVLELGLRPAPPTRAC